MLDEVIYPLREVRFSTVTKVVTFVVGCRIFSNGMGWRFVTLYYPWVYTPYWGVFCFSLTSRLPKMLGGGRTTEQMELLLYGRGAIAEVTEAKQTGTFINEQPQIRFSLNYNDEKGNTHYVALKKIVLLNELHNAGPEPQAILYLPDRPQEIMFAQE